MGWICYSDQMWEREIYILMLRCVQLLNYFVFWCWVGLQKKIEKKMKKKKIEKKNEKGKKNEKPAKSCVVGKFIILGVGRKSSCWVQISWVEFKCLVKFYCLIVLCWAQVSIILNTQVISMALFLHPLWFYSLVSLRFIPPLPWPRYNPNKDLLIFACMWFKLWMSSIMCGR